jgi:16S rRNA (cytosine967-C5)-methyltransferase
MKKSSLVGHILEVLELIQSQSRPADVVLSEFFRSRHYLGSRDRRYVSEVLYGILRNYFLLEAYAAAARDSAGLSNDLAAATSQELYVAYARVVLKEDPLSILPDIDSFWSDARIGMNAALYLDAVDRGVVPPAGADPVRHLALSHSMPEVIVREWVERFGEQETRDLCAASNLPAPVTVRVNTLRCSVDECQSMLRADGVTSTRTVLSPVGLRLEKRVNVQALPAFRDGAFEMQDEGSQIVTYLLEPSAGSQVVDACAGAGGKTLQIAAMMGNKGSILACDPERRRLDALRDRARRAGVTIVQPCVSGDDLIDQRAYLADAVLIDAPCTGVGTFRRNPWAKMTFTLQTLTTAAKRQRSILSDYSRLVRPGGRLVYATCSLLTEENEQVVNQFLQDHLDFLPVSASEILGRQGIHVPSRAQSPFLNLLPHKSQTDGFFGAVMERKGG